MHLRSCLDRCGFAETLCFRFQKTAIVHGVLSFTHHESECKDTRSRVVPEVAPPLLGESRQVQRCYQEAAVQSETSYLHRVRQCQLSFAKLRSLISNSEPCSNKKGISCSLKAELWACCRMSPGLPHMHGTGPRSGTRQGCSMTQPESVGTATQTS